MRREADAYFTAEAARYFALSGCGDPSLYTALQLAMHYAEISLRGPSPVSTLLATLHSWFSARYSSSVLGRPSNVGSYHSPGRLITLRFKSHDGL